MQSNVVTVRLEVQMRVMLFLTIVVCLAACGDTLAQTVEDHDAATAPATSVFRASYRVAAINRCRIDLIKTGIAMAEIDMACPCMADEILAVTPNDADLWPLAPQVVNEAVAKCAAKAETQFGTRSSASPSVAGS